MPFQLADLLRPFEDFFKRQAAGGITLLGATLLALGLANSPFSDFYHRFWEWKFTVGLPGFELTKSLHFWINDGLMAVFFFVVGLEIKREFLAGELSSLRQAGLPIAAALGGMVLPALIYHFLVPEGAQARGWGIPMATDIAFALGVLALLGNRISRSLAIFLTALAIVDDLGAVVVIAVFYTGEISLGALAWVAGLLVLLFIGNRLGLQHPNYYALLGFALWVAMLKSGVHASVAGVLIGATIPVKPRRGREEFLNGAERLIQRFRDIEVLEGPFLREEKLGTLSALEHVCAEAMSPLQRMEHAMNPWVIFGVMPVFALANAGIPLDLADLGPALAHPVTRGVALGLLVGKPVGIFLFSWAAVRMGVAELPSGATWPEIFGIGVLGGIGFTMSLFITNLAFVDPQLVDAAKASIFAASLLAGIAGFALLSLTGKKRSSSASS